jgi:hypothetical protein
MAWPGAGTCNGNALALRLTSGQRFNARTVSLCSHTLAPAVKWMHRMGTFVSFARFTQTARVSGSALVLSRRVPLVSLLLSRPCTPLASGVPK